MRDYFLCGWRVRSALTVPELAPWPGDDRAPDITIMIGAVPDELAGAVPVSPLLQVGAGCALFSVENVAGYLVRDGREVTIDPRIDPAAPDLRVFLLSTVFGLLCHQRKLFPLHAACVAVGGKALALAAASGRGKSTLGAALALRGHSLLADSVCVVDPFAPSGPQVLPAFSYAALWQDAAIALALPQFARLPNRQGQNKYRYPIGDKLRFRTLPVPLAAVALLEWANRAKAPGAVPLTGMRSALALNLQVYRQRTAALWGLTPDLFRSATAVADQCRVVRLIHEYGLSAIGNTVDRLEGLIAR